MSDYIPIDDWGDIYFAGFKKDLKHFLSYWFQEDDEEKLYGAIRHIIQFFRSGSQQMGRLVEKNKAAEKYLRDISKEVNNDT